MKNLKHALSMLWKVWTHKNSQLINVPAVSLNNPLCPYLKKKEGCCFEIWIQIWWFLIFPPKIWIFDVWMLLIKFLSDLSANLSFISEMVLCFVRVMRNIAIGSKIDEDTLPFGRFTEELYQTSTISGFFSWDVLYATQLLRIQTEFYFPGTRVLPGSTKPEPPVVSLAQVSSSPS